MTDLRLARKKSPHDKEQLARLAPIGLFSCVARFRANDAGSAGPGRGTPQEWNSGAAHCGLSARQSRRDVCAIVRSDLTGRRRDLVAGDEVALDVLAASARRIVNVESCEGDDGLTRRRGLFDHRHQYINVGW